MPSLHETAYPRLRTSVTAKDLADVYTPTDAEIRLADSVTRGFSGKLCFLALLKTFQRLGYFVLLKDVPEQILRHIATAAGGLPMSIDLAAYDASGSRRRHVLAIRAYLEVQPYSESGEVQALLTSVLRQAAQTKEDLADIINVGIEELVHHRFELPAFRTLHDKAQSIRAEVNRGVYGRVAAAIGPDGQKTLDELLVVPSGERTAPWQMVKEDPGPPTISHLRRLVTTVEWLLPKDVGMAALAGVPDAKVKQFAAEAKSLDAHRMRSMEPNKRYTLAAALVKEQIARGLDDIGQMFIKRMTKIHHKGKEALSEYRVHHQAETDRLIMMLHDVLTKMKEDGSAEQRLAAMEACLRGPVDDVIERCRVHASYANDNYNAFLWKFYQSHRQTLFRLLEYVELKSTSQDRTVEEALSFLRKHRNSKGDWLDISEAAADGNPLNLSWVPEKWRKLVTGNGSHRYLPTQVDRRQFEVCLFSQLMTELKAGDMCIDGSDKFSDYRDQLVSWDEYDKLVDEYSEQVGLPVEGDQFVGGMREWLEQVAAATDAAFPANHTVRIEDGRPKMSRPSRQPSSAQQKTVERLIASRLESVNILDVLVDAENWLGWTKPFGPLSGYDARIEDHRERYVATTFCYGCGLGPSQTSRCVPGLDRRQLAWVNQRHVTENGLEEAITEVVNRYNLFRLPKLWGSGKSAAADGTKWDLYEQNLLSEYHIRYGGYGGIGYYHVSDTYIALFSHFIPCGVWEAVYILDGLLNNESDIQPDTLHADTQGQNLPVFGLAYLLGIKLMPRIRNWVHLDLFRPGKDIRYEHIEALFSDPVDWQLIDTHLPDMLRVAVSIKAGRIAPSTLLRKLGSYSRKNKLYVAMRELGRVVRTVFLLEYLSDPELRRVIHAATNKCEHFNKFTKWLSFGGNETIPENDRDKQRKVIKYNHLVANCLIFHNVQSMTRILQELAAEGHEFDDEVLSRLSPYLTGHVNRFGRYTLDMGRSVVPLEFERQAAPVET